MPLSSRLSKYKAHRAQSSNSTNAVKKRSPYPTESKEKCGQMATKLSSFRIRMSSRLSLEAKLCTSSLMLKPRRPLSPMVYKFSNSRTIRLRNISQMERKRSVSLMELSSVFSATERRRAYSLMGLSRKLKRLVFA